MSRRARKAKLTGILCSAVGGVLWALVAALLLTIGIAGCGSASGSSSGSSKEAAVRVGPVVIDRAEVAHWARAIERGSSVATALQKTSGTPRERALEFLISSNWILGEAEEQGLQITNSAVQRGLQQKIDALPNGRAEFQEELSSTGQSLADVELEVRSALALTALRNAVTKRTSAPTGAEVASYYAHHRRKFYLPDRRVVDLNDGIHSYADAVALAEQVTPDARLGKSWVREIVSRSPGGGDRGKLVDMIFATPLERTTSPAVFHGHWVIAVVRKLIPAGIQPFAAVRSGVSSILVAQRSEQVLRRFAAAYVAKWTARTSCTPGYVVRKCSQQRGAPAGEMNPLTGG